MNDSIKEYILELLARKSPLPVMPSYDAFLYLDAGQIDSLGLIKFIVEIEDHFEIEFSPEETQSAQFRAVGTLVHMITTKILAKDGKELR